MPTATQPQMQQAFKETLDWANQNGLRFPLNPQLNNIFITLFGIPDFYFQMSPYMGGPYNAYLGCGDQQQLMTKVLKTRKYHAKAASINKGSIYSWE